LSRSKWVLLALVVLAVAACGGDDDESGDTDDRGAGSANPLADVTWQWQEFLGGDDTVLTPDDPSRYTLTFNDDGTASIQADCNQVVASYSIDATQLTIEPGPSTMAACPEGSLSDRYVTLLSAATSYVMDGDELVISLFDDAGTMHFLP
jgi:para-nitrobenzyl esterase